MNALITAFVRWAGLLLIFGAAVPLLAQQDDKSLTDGFSKLSAKERTRIAEQENRDAEADTAYQRLMRQADLAFRQARYQDALGAFEEARARRPYNVYPKVKIQDLRALIRKKEEEAANQPGNVQPPAPSTPAIAAPPPPGQQTEPTPRPLPPNPASPAPAAAIPLDPAPAPEPASMPSAPSTVEPVHVEPAPAVKPDIPPPQTAPYPPQPRPMAQEPKGVQPPGERIYKEAGAVVTERTVADDGQMVTYKKVVHPWGQTFYFKDGRSIPARAWNERFKE